MKKIPLLLLLLLILATGYAAYRSFVRQASAAPGMALPADVPAASVNGERISLLTLEDARQVVLQNGGQDLSRPESYQQAFDLLVRSVVLRQEAARRGIEVSDAEIGAALQNGEKAPEGAVAPLSAQAIQQAAQAGGLQAQASTAQQMTFQAVRNALLEAKVMAALRAEAPQDTDPNAWAEQTLSALLAQAQVEIYVQNLPKDAIGIFCRVCAP